MPFFKKERNLFFWRHQNRKNAVQRTEQEGCCKRIKYRMFLMLIQEKSCCSQKVFQNKKLLFQEKKKPNLSKKHLTANNWQLTTDNPVSCYRKPLRTTRPLTARKSLTKKKKAVTTLFTDLSRNLQLIFKQNL